MYTYLLAWNNKRFDWTEINEAIAEINNIGFYEGSWSCGRNKSIQPGDRLFLIKLGQNPKGLCASGVATSTVNQDDHWEGDLDKLSNYIDFKFDILLNPKKEDVLGLDILKNEVNDKQLWTPQNSGIKIQPHIADKLERVWSDFLKKEKKIIQKYRNGYLTKSVFVEGAIKQVLLTKYERDRDARKACIEHHQAKCKVCNFDFFQTYGKIGEGFIHVHHLIPVSSKKKEYTLNPTEDIVPVCPNCHAMLHTAKPPITVNELKIIIEDQKK